MLKAFSTHVTSSEFRSAMYPGESFNLELFLGWMQTTHSLKGSLLNYLDGMIGATRRTKAAASHLPLHEADEIAVGTPMKFWREWLQHTEPNDQWWASEDYSCSVAGVSAPNHVISGWYDFLLPQLLRDYTMLEQANRTPYLTIGPWSHSSNGLFEVCLRESLLWLRAHLFGETNPLRTSPIRIYVMGADEWRDIKTWPPTHTQQRWYLQPEAGLATDIPPGSQATTFCYDPGDPTPNVGGAINTPLGRGAGAQDNRKLEARPDVLVFTSPPLSQHMEVIGPVSAELFVRSSLEHTDFFVRLCDVHPDGRSMNVCDGLLRLFPERPVADSDGCRKAVIDLWPTAHRFKALHCIRVHVSSGAFPRFARNVGTGEPLATATTMKVAEQSILHDRDHPSAVILPLV
jgi:hypothetical protein